MFIGVDGTGVSDEGRYSADMRLSFISELVKSAKSKNAIYLRGPTLAGLQDQILLDSVLNSIRIFAKSGDTQISLAGYSRGGVIAIRAAQKLAHLSWGKVLRVNCLLLFDAVERDLFFGGSSIPSNVENAYHAMRAYEVGSRWYFGNCGQSIQGHGRLLKRHFRATHAAMGGIPWTGDHPEQSKSILATTALRVQTSTPMMITHVPTITEDQDIQASMQVRQWMWGFAKLNKIF